MKKLAMIIGCVATVAIAGLAFYSNATAGQKAETRVYISGSTAAGSIGATRNSANTVENIGCSYQVELTTVGEVYDSSVYCFARDASGGYLSCSSTVPEMIEAVRAIDDDSYLRFTKGSDGQCLKLVVESNSIDPPRLQ